MGLIGFSCVQFHTVQTESLTKLNHEYAVFTLHFPQYFRHKCTAVGKFLVERLAVNFCDVVVKNLCYNFSLILL